MDNSSFTDEQLLNLVNNTINKKTEFNINDFTGGGVQITSIHNHQIVKHKIYLTFGYDDKRNSKSYREDIKEDVSFIWQQALLLKVKTMQTLHSGSSLSELNELMNQDFENGNPTIDRDSKIEIEDRDKECNDIVPTSLRNPPPLKKTTTRFKSPTLEEVEIYIKEKNYNVNADTFFNFYESNGWKVGKNKMKVWKASVATWNSKEKTNQTKQPYNTPQSQVLNTDINIWDAIKEQNKPKELAHG